MWEDHVRYAITTEEWAERREAYMREWIVRDPAGLGLALGVLSQGADHGAASDGRSSPRPPRSGSVGSVSPTTCRSR